MTTSDLTTPSHDSPPSRGPVGVRTWAALPAVPGWASIGAGALAWVATLPVLRAVFTDADRGLDMMDESHYLMAAQPWADTKAFNGVWGWYSGPLLRLVGADLGRFRVLAGLVLVVAALVLARALRLAAQGLVDAPWPGWLRAVWPPGVVSAALCYYTVFVRTPSYNWFAAVGLMLLAAGLVRAVAGPLPRRWDAIVAGALIASGSFVTAIGKTTTALGATTIALLAVGVHAATARSRRRALAPGAMAAVIVGAVLLLVHVTLVNGLSTTVATYRRVAGMLARVDPYSYTSGTVVKTAVAGTRDVLLDRPWLYLPFLLMIVIAAVVPWLGARSPGWWLGGAYGFVVALPLAAILRAYPGGVPGLAMSSPALVIAAEAGVLVAAVTVLWWRVAPARLTSDEADATGDAGAPVRRPGTALLLAVALLGIGACYPLGTNVEYATQLHGGFPVLLAAAVIGVCCVPDRGWVVAVAVLAVAAVALGGVLVPTTRAESPYRISLLDQQTIPRSIVPGTPPILVDPDTAQWIDDLRADAQRGGFVPGGPVLDLTWHPASVLVLGGRAPTVLIPAFPGWPTPGDSAEYALRQEDPQLWRSAWLLVPTAQDDAVADQATSVLGLHFPADYEQVGVVTAPYDRQEQGLWRPR